MPFRFLPFPSSVLHNLGRVPGGLLLSSVSNMTYSRLRSHIKQAIPNADELTWCDFITQMLYATDSISGFFLFHSSEDIMIVCYLSDNTEHLTCYNLSFQLYLYHRKCAARITPIMYMYMYVCSDQPVLVSLYVHKYCVCMHVYTNVCI